LRVSVTRPTRSSATILRCIEDRANGPIRRTKAREKAATFRRRPGIATPRRAQRGRLADTAVMAHPAMRKKTKEEADATNFRDEAA
jgi:hypothetical protein